ncbi:uncharacterized protein LOC122457420 [Dermochelys coriacea]|uniref:uncharacterized protein LOC122457420 n=1 Tax=Dermochelys coriacea TaxID=27794 RepID=UPI001CA81537|nr:uncharacterized protein LOC122457420 [Dermochelys coriacea]
MVVAGPSLCPTMVDLICSQETVSKAPAPPPSVCLSLLVSGSNRIPSCVPHLSCGSGGAAACPPRQDSLKILRTRSLRELCCEDTPKTVGYSLFGVHSAWGQRLSGGTTVLSLHSSPGLRHQLCLVTTAPHCKHHCDSSAEFPLPAPWDPPSRCWKQGELPIGFACLEYVTPAPGLSDSLLAAPIPGVSAPYTQRFAGDGAARPLSPLTWQPSIRGSSCFILLVRGDFPSQAAGPDAVCAAEFGVGMAQLLWMPEAGPGNDSNFASCMQLPQEIASQKTTELLNVKRCGPGPGA